MKRYVNIYDKFLVRCKRCGSTNVSLMVNNCEECGDTVSASCNNCKNKFDYHDFEEMEVTYPPKK